MWKGTFKLGGEVVEVVVDGNQLLFYDTSSQMTTTLEGLKFSKAGVLIEFPDLKNNKEWKEIAINRLKEHIKSIPIEEHKLNYVKAELIKHGYVPMFKQRAGFRPKKFEDEKWVEDGIG